MSRSGGLKQIEHGLERWLFRSRWLLVPPYVMLAGVLAVLGYKSLEEFVQLILNLRAFDEARTILQALTIVDVVLVINLVLMVLFVGYTNFVSVFDFKEYVDAAQEPDSDARGGRRHSDVPPWMSRLDYSGLKVQLMGSIIAISAITTLRVFLELANGAHVDEIRMLWTVVTFVAFLLAALIIAIINRLKHFDPEAPAAQTSRDRASGRLNDRDAL